MADDRLLAGLERLRTDSVHGSSYLADFALQLLGDLSWYAPTMAPDEFVSHTKAWALKLAAARSSMVAIANSICEAYALFCQWLHRSRHHPALLLGEAVRRVLRRNAARRRLTTLRAIRQLKGSVLTISYSGTLVQALKMAPALERVYVAEGRPLREGVTLAMELVRTGIRVTLITEAQLRLCAEKCHMAVVGADAVLPDGSIVTKVGSYLMALAAKDAGIPYLAVADTSKIAPSIVAWCPSLMEVHPRDEVLPEAPSDLEIWNYYFERVPPTLVTGTIGERGLMDPATILRVADTRSRYHAALFGSSEPQTLPEGA